MISWERVQELFLRTVDLPAEERRRLLDAWCEQDPELRAEVESLLASDCDRGTIIAEALKEEVSLLFDAEVLAGKRVGAYRIVREIGRGGMGAVYLATRDDEAYQKQVAVKVVKPGMDTADFLDRFRHERQILAGLEHPYIARLFDGGSTDQGLPFFVMEYVEGQPVNSFCRGNTLNNRARCDLFLKILDAVSYAHRNLVVHRDLKPGNILVTKEGTPKLLDFGLAKLIGGNGDGSHTVFNTLLRPFTPEYASPEQVLGLSMTTATDIYSLGAVLYELLTDRRAQPISTPTPSQIERTVCEVNAPRPSQIAPTVDEDLDNIVLMAMRKEPERRYHSVDQFAEDIQHYLHGRPILARQDSVTYRLRKFLVRNRLEIAMVSILILGLAAGLAVSLLQTRRAGKARVAAESQRLIALRENARAQSEARRAQQALEAEARQSFIAEEQRDAAQHEKTVADERANDLFELANRALFDVSSSIEKLPGSLDARKELVKTTLDYLERLRNENGLDDRMRLTLSQAYYKVSMIQGSYYFPSLQDFKGAEASLRKAAAIIQPLYERNPRNPTVTSQYLDIQIELANNLQEAGRPEAVAIYSQLLPLAHRIAQVKTCNIECQKHESEIENQLAEAYLRVDDPHGLEHADREVELSRKMLAQDPDNLELKRDVAISLSSAAAGQKAIGDLEKAAEDFRESIQIREALLREQPHDVETHRGLFVAYGNYAAVLGIPWSPNLGRPTDAREMATKCVALARESVAADSQDATARFDLAMALERLGTIDPAPAETTQSLAILQEAIGLMKPAVNANPESSPYATQFALLLEYQGHRLEALGQTQDAVRDYRESLEALRPFLEAGGSMVTHQNLASEEALALAYASAGNLAAASQIAVQTVTEAEKYDQAAPSDPRKGDLARAYATLAAVQQKGGNLPQAWESAEKAMGLWNGIHNAGVLSIRASMRSDTEALLSTLNAPALSK
jgi:serine/threonine protein kinase/tetratricopeptide (TPR) repeat protein